MRETVRLTATLFADSRPVDEVLERAGIADIGDPQVGKCSGGQQQRLRFAMALLSDPGLLILDEPTTGMDVEGRREFWNAIRADAAAAAPSSSRRTTSTRPTPTPTASSWCARAGSSPTAPPPRSRTSRPGAPSVPPSPASTSAQSPRSPASTPSSCAATRCSIPTRDSDAVARYLLTPTDARDVEITSHSLEDAFIALTSEDSAS